MPPCQRNGRRSSLNKISPVLPQFSVFWNGGFLFTITDVLLDIPFMVWKILHNICGLAIQNLTNLIQGLHRQMLHRADANRRYRGRTDACLFCQFLLGHATHGKHNFDLKLNHFLSPLPSGHCITLFVVNQYAMRKIISYFVKGITICVLTNYEFRSILSM